MTARSAWAGVLLTAAVLSLSACAAGRGGPGPRNGPPLRQTANASAVIAQEFAFSRAVQERGLWPAFADYAAPEAVLYVPDQVRAQDWLKRRAAPLQVSRWQPHAVWSSCDGSLAVTHGGWQRADGGYGQYVVVWRREGMGAYKWVLELDGTLAAPLTAPEMITAQSASCARPEVGAATPPAGPPSRGAAAPQVPQNPLAARDQSLTVHVVPAAGGGQDLRVVFLRDGAPQDVLVLRLDGSGMGAR